MTGSGRKKLGGKKRAGSGKSAEVNSRLKESGASLMLEKTVSKRWRWWEMREVDRNKETGKEEGSDSSAD